MSFDDLPPLPPLIHPQAQAYAERALALTRAVQARMPVDIDIRYGDDYWQKLDIYRPAAVSAPLPVLVFLHGGAWSNGTKEWVGFMAPPVLALPAILVAANYRLAPACRFPGPAEDCCDALAWVHANIARHGGDPRRIHLGGHSAGGHLAALTALRRDLLAARGLPPDVVKSCFPVSGSFDLRHRDAPPGSMERRIYEVFLARPEDDAAASPIVHAAGTPVSFALAWGSRDFDRLLDQGAAMAAALRANGARVRTLVLEGCDHFDANFACAEPAGAWMDLLRASMRDGYAGATPR